MIEESEALPMTMATDISAFCPTGVAGATSMTEVGPRAGPRHGAGPDATVDLSRRCVICRPSAVTTSRTGSDRFGNGGNVRIGVMFETEIPFDESIAQVASLRDAGIQTAWSSQIFGYDALTALAAIGREVSGIDLGTAVVPTYPRHPVMLAGQALTVQAASGGRLTLGIGLSHQVVIENVFGQPFEKPARHMREYLSILIPLLEGEQVSFAGETLSASTFGPLQIDAPAPPVLVAALGPAMLGIAGAMASGTVTWMTGPATVEAHVIPTIREAAAAAGRPVPRIGVGLPVCVTGDADSARDKAAEVFAIYGQLPSYRAMLDREGAAGPADVAIIGTESEVKAQVGRLADIGVTDFCGAPFGSVDEIKATIGVLAESVDARRWTDRGPLQRSETSAQRVCLNSLRSGWSRIRPTTRSMVSRARRPSPSGRVINRANTALVPDDEGGYPEDVELGDHPLVFVAHHLGRPSGIHLGQHRVCIGAGALQRLPDHRTVAQITAVVVASREQ